jgi:hypothetical protein
MAIRSLSRRGLDASVYGDVGDILKYAIGPDAQQRYSKTSSAHILEVRDGKGLFYPNLNDSQLTDSIKVMAEFTNSTC